MTYKAKKKKNKSLCDSFIFFFLVVYSESVSQICLYLMSQCAVFALDGDDDDDDSVMSCISNR